MDIACRQAHMASFFALANPSGQGDPRAVWSSQKRKIYVNLEQSQGNNFATILIHAAEHIEETSPFPVRLYKLSSYHCSIAFLATVLL